MKVRFRMICLGHEEAQRRSATGPKAVLTEGLTMIVCECTGTTDATIRAIARDGATTVSEVVRRCGAGGCCQSCRPLISRILRATAKAEASPPATRADSASASAA